MTVKIVAGDCLTLTDASAFDCMLTDPPYSEHVHENATSSSGKRGTRHRDLGFGHLTPELRAKIISFAGQVKRWSVIYSDIEGFGDWLSAARAVKPEPTYIRGIPWCRWSMPSLCKWPPQGAEMLAIFYGSARGRKEWNGPGNLTHLSHTALRGEQKHKCQKPLDQLLDIVEFFSNEGDCVLDPCAGSGTTALACKLLNRNCVSYEIDPVWAARAQERLSASTLSRPDQERYDRWRITADARSKDAERRRLHNVKVRSRLEST